VDTIFLARQPIYDRHLNVFAYELLFRSKITDLESLANDSKATSEVCVSALMDIGLEYIVGNRLAFINMTRDFLDSSLPMPQFQGQGVLEILEDEVPDDKLINALEKLTRLGYRIALDDFVYTSKHDRILELAHFVKLDIKSLSFDEIPNHIKLLRNFNVELLAEKVETQIEFEKCHALGFDYFQGFFFCKPQIVTGKRTKDNRLVVLRFLAQLQDPSVSIDDLENLISQDASLVYHLLRYMNSAFYNLRTTVKSIKHALTLLGIDEVRKWASLMLMLRLSNEKPKELMVTGLIRAKMAELLGSGDKANSPDQYYTVGLFSILSALMDMELPDILNALPLNEEMSIALKSYTGVIGETLQRIIFYEQAQWEKLTDVDYAAYQKAYLQAIEWAEDLCSSLE